MRRLGCRQTLHGELGKARYFHDVAAPTNGDVSLVGKEETSEKRVLRRRWRRSWRFQRREQVVHVFRV